MHVIQYGMKACVCVCVGGGGELRAFTHSGAGNCQRSSFQGGGRRKMGNSVAVSVVLNRMTQWKSSDHQKLIGVQIKFLVFKVFSQSLQGS